MQLTAPLFLFVFLPLSLPVALFFPRRLRMLGLSLLSLAFYWLANRNNPLGLAAVGLLLLVPVALCYLPPARARAQKWSRSRTVLGVILPLALFCAARVLALLPLGFTYPLGLGFVTLSAVSLALDRRRAAPHPPTPAHLLAYLLFFPTLSVGPVLHYNRFLRMSARGAASPALFCDGVCLYMTGFVKRIALAAVMARALRALLSGGALSLPFLLTALCLSLFLLHFFLSGTADMARGIAAMYGLRLPADRASIWMVGTPDRLFYRMLLPFYRYFRHYVGDPLRAAVGGRGGRVAAAGAVWLCVMLFLGFRPVLLLASLPILACALVSAARGHAVRARRPLLLRLVLHLLSLLAVAVLAFVGFADTLVGREVLWRLPTAEMRLPFYNVFLAASDARYLALAGLLLLPAWLLSRLPTRHMIPPRLRALLRPLGTALLFVLFVLCTVYLLPQFPSYAHSLFPS